MRIKKVTINNYRQFKNTVFSFEKNNKDKDLHLIIGQNGTGKTNFLNAINWCLYGDEPHLSNKSQQLPLANLNNIEKGLESEIKVEITFEIDENSTIIFSRISDTNTNSQKDNSSNKISKLKVQQLDAKGNTKILETEQANDLVNRAIPEKIREFFFFDGERLDSYFKEATNQNIRNAIFDISQIDLLEKLEERLDSIIRDIRKEAGGINPLIENKRKDLEQKEKDLDSLKIQKEECIKEIEFTKFKIKEYEEQLKGTPEAERLEKQREELIEKRNEKRKRIEEKNNNKKEYLFEVGKIIMLLPAIKKSISIISEKRNKKEIPPTIDKTLLENIIKEGICSVCGKPLDDSSKKHVAKILEDIKISSEIAKELLMMENPLLLFKMECEKFAKNIEKIKKDINEDEKELNYIQKRIDRIDKELNGYNLKNILALHEQRKKYENVFEEKHQNLGSLIQQVKIISQDIESLKKDLDEEIKKEKKASELKKQIDFCENALNVLIQSKQQIMNETREKIEQETKNLFFQLIWKQKTFKDVMIDENYDIKIIHSSGYECLGSLSAAERELLMLSFTLALHKVSGFESPILIDTPLARVSDIHKENFGKVFSEVSRYKQIILLFTPSEYSGDICNILDQDACTKNRLVLLADENEVILEVPNESKR